MRTLVLLNCIILWMLPVQAAAVVKTPAIKIVAAGEIEAIPVDVAGSMKPAPAFEGPPEIVAGAPKLFFVTTGWSWLCRASEPVTVGVRLTPAACKLFSAPDRIDPSTGKTRTPAEAARQNQDWGRSYLGVFSALTLPHPWHAYDLLVILHGENKNERLGSDFYANTVDPNLAPATCASGYDAAGKYSDCWAAYNAFISLRLAHTASAPSNELDLGPILWPTMGYREGGKKTSGGLRDPSAIAVDGYLYIFYTDSSQSSEDGRRGGVHVARMVIPATDASQIGPAFPYYNGAFQNGNPSLPAGFSKERIMDYYNHQGGRASELWPNSWQTGRFTVARVKDTHLFLGVEEYNSAREWGVRLRVSSDLTHWSDPVAVPGEYSAGGYAKGTMYYPVFSDLSGQTSAEIDPNGFYLLGAQSGGHIVRQKLKIALIQ